MLVLNGANMNWLGKREPEFYGTRTLEEVNALVAARAAERGCSVEFFQSNVEGLAMDRIYAAAEAGVDGLLMNPAGFSHAGYALRDCLRAVRLPYVEVHMSNTEARGIEPVTSGEAVGVVAGLGANSYLVGLDALLGVIAERRESA
ncbi:MAG: type II 3-dehydroquinate dehydratase [Alphaproteobacteria bacterium]|nr:type II 3-dehydroquinate dehydratase [Alphaproteobacteria bacterium]MDP7429357.1 type II 3-dehydroquinate dehydratase [Alphaproteobacteria bacterium]